MPLSFLKSLFSSKKPEPVYGQQVWSTQEGKFKALMERAQEANRAGKRVLLLAWFPKTFQELDYLLANLNMPYSKGVADAAAPIVLDLADNYLKRLQHPTVDYVWVAEHYPLHGPEVALFELLQQNLPQVKPLVFASMDEGLFTVFGGERIVALMERMGLAKDEMIEHNMIKRSIVNAQTKLAEKVPAEVKAQSGNEWLQLNHKPLA